MTDKFKQYEIEENIEFSKILRNKANKNTPAYSSLFKQNVTFAPSKKFQVGFEKTLAKENVFRSLVTVINTQDRVNCIKTMQATGVASVVDENKAYPINNDDFRELRIKPCKIGSVATLNNSFVGDSKFDVDSYLQNEFAKRFGDEEERLIINGTGNNEPNGIINSENIVTAESNTITYNDMVNLFLGVDNKYAKHGAFIVNRKTALALRLIKDENGNPIWNINDDTIFSKPVVISEHMPDIATGNKPVAFGDLSYYWLIITSPLEVQVLSEHYAKYDATGYIANERLDGKLIRDDAVALLQIS